MSDMDLDTGGAEPTTLSRDQIGALWDQRETWRNIQVNHGMDGDADAAAQSKQLEDITGVPAALIAENHDEFVANEKKLAARHIVSGNQDLEDYVMSHPLATTISNDDWGNLDKMTRESSGGLLQSLFPGVKPLAAGVEGAIEGAAQGFSARGFWDGNEEVARAEDPHQNMLGVLGSSAATAVFGVSDLLYRVMNAVGAGIQEGAGSIGDVADPALGRDIRGVVESEFNRGMAESGMHGAHAQAQAKPSTELGVGGIEKHDLHMMRQQLSGLDFARPWFEAGEEPPTGLHPEIDTAKAKINEDLLKLIETDLANSVGTETRERSPEMMDYIQTRKYGDLKLGLGADRALELYGDKEPTADDGLLGWVPDIGTQLMAARDFGHDVQIPIKDMLTRGDPELFKELHDDLKVWPGGVTVNEAKELPTEPKQVVDETLPMVRAAAGLEPKFSMGDRKLTLDVVDKMMMKAGPEGTVPMVPHNIDMLDENGKKVGEMEVTPAKDKTLYVNWIGGQAGAWSNTFGPALVRDIKRQLKGLFPDYEYLTGHRVSGARYGDAMAEREAGPSMPLPKVRLDVDAFGNENFAEDHRLTSDIFQNGWQEFTGSVLANRQDIGFFTPEERQTGQAVVDEINKITGGHTDVEGVAGIWFTGNTVTRGLYQPYENARPSILFDLLGPDPTGAGRHEAIHLLRGYNFFKPEEWSLLEQTAKSEGWIDRYNIDKRYASLKDEDKLEEAIAEGFREWAAQAPEVRSKTGIGAVFQKLADLFDRLKARLGLGPEATWEDLFAKVKSGEVGERGPSAPRDAAAFDMRAKFSIEDQRKAAIEGMENIQAASMGLDAVRFGRLQNLIRKQAESDLAVATARAEKEATKRSSQEWKSNRVEMLKEVSDEIRQRPDIAADLFIGSGELGGRKMQQRFTLAEGMLTPEQRAVLPDHYVSKHGLDPNHVAGLFGYSSGADMVERLGLLEAAKNAGGKRVRTEDLLRKMTQDETERRMQQRYGANAATALDDARDAALSESSRNVSYEEYRAVAESQGLTAYSKSVMQRAARNLLNETRVGDLDSKTLFRQMGLHARNAQRAQIDGKWAEAAVHMQRHSMTHELAGLAAAKEKEVTRFEKDAKTWGRYKYGKAASSMDSGYANVIQQLLSQIGKKVAPTAEWLKREMEESGHGVDVRTFVDEQMKWGATIAPWEDLYDPKTTFDFKQMRVDQFDRANDFLRTLVKNGRDEKKLYKAEVAFEFAERKAALMEGLDRLRSVSESGLGKGARTVNSLLIQMETYIDKLDEWDPTGVWNDFLLRPLFETEHVEMDRIREVTKSIHDIVKLKFDNKEIPSPFRNPRNGQPVVANRETLWAAMLNQGTDENRLAFAKSWGLKPDGVRAWIDSHATKQDWDGVQKIWDLFRKTGEWSNDEYRRLSDRAMRWLEPVPVETQHGTYAGGYYPIMHHPDFPGKSANLLGLSNKALFGSGYSTGIVPGAGYRIERTGDISPQALDLKQVAGRLVEQIHDGAMRGAIQQAAKILRDPAIKDAMIEKLGIEVWDGMVKHLRRVANNVSPSADMSRSARNVLGIGDYIRRNVISNMIGLNLGTIEKHGPTAFITSVAGLGLPKMLSAYHDIWSVDEESGMRTRKLIYEKSALMRGRQRYWMDTIYGSVGKIHDENTMVDKFMRFRDWSQWLGTQGVAWSDAVSAEPLWWGTYKDSLQNGEGEGTAVYKADKAVRKAHGAGGVVGQPLVVNEFSKWFTPMYNFYNSVLNKAVESYWRAGVARKAFKEGDYQKMLANLKPAAIGGFVSIVMPTIIHDLVSPPKTTPDESWESRIIKYIAGPMAAFIPMGGNAMEYLTGSSTPDVGLQTAAMKQAMDFARDLTHKHPQTPAATEKRYRDGGSFMGFVLGVGGGRTLGNWAGALHEMYTGAEHPRSLSDVHSMVRFGTTHREH